MPLSSATTSDSLSPPAPDATGGRGAPDRRAGPFVADLRTLRILWRREMTRFLRNRARLVMGLAAPLLFLFVLGNGIGSAGGDLGHYQAFLFPGTLLMVVQGPAVAVGTVLMWDRQSGFLRQMLVAPVRRGAILAGICLGGATTGALYALPVLALAGPMGLPYHPRLLLVLGEVALLSFALTALGVSAAVCIRRPETFQIVSGLAMAPAMLLSGALFPVGGLPSWLGAAVLANPLSYGVDALRRTMPDPDPTTAAPAWFHAGPEWWGWTPPVLLELALVVLPSLLLLLLAGRRFARID
ncbi:ABC transporter permease [Streptomyces sp. CA-210063]|uniref:ABC transporter permease n=1 Tax=Streptomyces sp. CA-210063 TaxID=2801029 RepID=UPI00214CC17B|nr:ABC transporter permease [Streptomyces sp. CA-210063]UUU31702.1 ABC transporter permease [Streptomyces sp. CA-210063]